MWNQNKTEHLCIISSNSINLIEYSQEYRKITKVDIGTWSTQGTRHEGQIRHEMPWGTRACRAQGTWGIKVRKTQSKWINTSFIIKFGRVLWALITTTKIVIRLLSFWLKIIVFYWVSLGDYFGVFCFVVDFVIG